MAFAVCWLIFAIFDSFNFKLLIPNAIGKEYSLTYIGLTLNILFMAQWSYYKKLSKNTPKFTDEKDDLKTPVLP